MRFLGVDVAGAKNTWACLIEASVGFSPRVVNVAKRALAEILALCDAEDVLGVCIDAPLTFALGEESGYRTADLELKDLLPAEHRGWVMSQSSMMAVPLRGQHLARALGPTVGTVLETHPRASLYLALASRHREMARWIKDYKKGADSVACCRHLWAAWTDAYGIDADGNPSCDGMVDALVCATVAYLFHRTPTELRRLHHRAAGRVGFGPFYVAARPGQPTS